MALTKFRLTSSTLGRSSKVTPLRGTKEGVDGSPLGFSFVSIFGRDFAFDRKPTSVLGLFNLERGEKSPGNKVFDVLHKRRYKLWVVALLGAYDVIQDGAYMGQLEIIEKRGQ